jgi:hypothetical protein
MIHEFAVDPALLSDSEKCRYVIENFDFHKGRLISRYPKKWQATVLEGLNNLHLRDVEKKRIEEKLRQILTVRRSEWEPQLDWLENAEKEHNRCTFQAILSITNPRDNNHVLCYQDLHENMPLWRVPTQQVVRRQAADMLDILKPVFRIAKKLAFIDPYLSKSSNINENKALYSYLKYCKELPNYPEIAFYTCNQGDQTFQSNCRRFGRLVPLGKKITFIYLKGQVGGDKVHNRYLLTDRGGVSFGWGVLDGKQGETDDVALMDPTVFQDRWEQYLGSTPAFTKELEFVVEGTAIK